MIVQPVQLSLLPEEYPAPPAILIAPLPGNHVAAAIALLAGLIARAAAPDAATAQAGGEVTGDE
jgi:hypothetical protein